jgi:hypothetical protein
LIFKWYFSGNDPILVHTFFENWHAMSYDRTRYITAKLRTAEKNRKVILQYLSFN